MSEELTRLKDLQMQAKKKLIDLEGELALINNGKDRELGVSVIHLPRRRELLTQKTELTKQLMDLKLEIHKAQRCGKPGGAL